jgi:hypothetical protein
LPSLTERTLRQRATPAEIAVVCQFTYLESERLLQCRRCIRHVNVRKPDEARVSVVQPRRPVLKCVRKSSVSVLTRLACVNVIRH